MPVAVYNPSKPHAANLEAMGYKIVDPTQTLVRGGVTAAKPVPAKPVAQPAAATGSQAGPPAKLPLPKAKLEAETVNAKQWGTQTLSGAGGTQAPPPAKLPLPKAKVEAEAVNKEQWLSPQAGAPSAAAPAPDATGTPPVDYVQKLEDLRKESTATLERRINQKK